MDKSENSISGTEKQFLSLRQSQIQNSKHFHNHYNFSIEKPVSSNKRNDGNSLSSVYQSFQRSSITSSNKEDCKLSNSNLQTQLLNETIENNMKQVLKILEEHDNVNLISIRDDELKTILHHAAANNNAFMFQTFLNFQTKQLKNKESNQQILIKWLTQQDNQGYYCIHYAAYKGNRQIIDIYQSYGCDINLPNNRGLTLIHIAAQSNQYVFMVFLKEKYKVDIYHEDHRQSTALHQACFFGSENCIDFLICWGLDVNHQDNDGCIPLHLAILEDRKSIIKKLLWKGSDARLCNKKNQNAIDIADEYQREEIKKLLTKSVSIQCKMAAASYQRSRSWAKFILQVTIFGLILSSQVIFVFPFIEIWEIWLLISIYILVVVFFFISYLMDPGYTRYKERVMINLVQQYPIEEICVYCQILKPQRSKHCEICQKCVILYDHHCPWINNCIGARNLLPFYIYLWCLELAILSSIITTIQIYLNSDLYFLEIGWFSELRHQFNINTNFYKKLQYAILSIFSICCFLFLIQLSSLIAQITQNLLKGITTYEKLLSRVSFQEKHSKSQFKNCKDMFFFYQSIKYGENNLL